jgi:demethylmenaquinone methyltransferase/2-methoxy-6-polyprenyl-1,4-benzoquinol methylase
MNRDLDKKLAERETSFRIFDGIHKRYDLLNRLFSFGRDIYWRRRMAKAVEKNENQHLLDLAAGTGDVAFSLLKHCPQISHAYGCDMARKMLESAQKKAHKKKQDKKISFIMGDAGNIPFKNNTFNVATIAFGIRNVTDPPQVLEEMKRVLKQGGKALILEFSLPASKIMRKLHLFYLRHIIPGVGALISRDKDAYRYLNKTIETFPYGESFCKWMREAGFGDVSFTPLTFGVATLYQGEK